MHKTRLFPSSALLLVLVCWPSAGLTAAAHDERPSVDVAICLDMSGTMEDLLQSAQLQLWEVVNELAAAEPVPRLRLALLTFGSARNAPAAGWVRVETGLTEDLDAVSQRLSELEIGGDTEYVGRVLQAAVERLDWAQEGDALKLVFIVGNEAAEQDPEISAVELAEEAKRLGISVSMVYAGDPRHPKALGWRDVARRAEGYFAAIEPGGGSFVLSSPVDEQIVELGQAMSSTFVPFGQQGLEGRQSQATQDQLARSFGSAVAATRAETKSGPFYSPAWDLVSAVETDPSVLDRIEPSELPEEMRKMSPEARRLYLDELRLEREELRQQIAALAAERRRIVARDTRLGGPGLSATFDSELRGEIRRRAEATGFSFPDR